MENITDYRQNETKNYRLPTGKIQLIDCRHGLTLSILVLRKKSILYFVSSDGLTEKISSFVVRGTLLRPISKSQKSHLNDATDFINFIEKKKVKKSNVSCFGPRNA